MNVEGDRLSGTPIVVFLAKTIGLIGAGCLGQEVIDALYNKGHRNIIATRRSQDKLRLLAEKYQGIRTSSDNCYAARESDVLILAVKPKLIDTVSREISQYAGDKLVISLAAAKTIEQLGQALSNKSVRLCRVMTGLYVAEEIAFYSLSEMCTQDDKKVIKYIFGQDAVEGQEELLAHRTWIACSTGLRANAIEEEIAELAKLGMSPQDAALVYAHDLEAIAGRLRAGINGKEILEAVGGPGSFTQAMAEYLAEQGHYKLLRECVARTVNACLGR